MKVWRSHEHLSEQVTPRPFLRPLLDSSSMAACNNEVPNAIGNRQKTMTGYLESNNRQFPSYWLVIMPKGYRPSRPRTPLVWYVDDACHTDPVIVAP
jgi:hypothetical protein